MRYVEYAVDKMGRFGAVVLLVLPPLWLGMIIGYWFGFNSEGGSSASAPSLAAVLAEPIEVKVSVSGTQPIAVAPPPSSSPVASESRPTASNDFLWLLARKAADAVSFARDTVTDTATIPATAAKKFLDSLASESGKEAGKDLVNFFGYLVSSLTKSSEKKEASKDPREVFAIIIPDRVGEPLSLGEVAIEKPSPEFVLFEPDDASLSVSAYKSIDNARAKAFADPKSVVLLYGNTDTTGSPAWNRELAQKRVRTVRDALITPGGIAANRVFLAELASDALPIITPEGIKEPRNRSVKIEIR